MKMVKQVRRLLAVVSLGGCLHIAACNGAGINDIILNNVRDTFVEIGTAVVENSADQVLGLE